MCVCRRTNGPKVFDSESHVGVSFMMIDLSTSFLDNHATIVSRQLHPSQAEVPNDFQAPSLQILRNFRLRHELQRQGQRCSLLEVGGPGDQTMYTHSEMSAGHIVNYGLLSLPADCPEVGIKKAATITFEFCSAHGGLRVVYWGKYQNNETNSV